jgi:hypothetical protein
MTRRSDGLVSKVLKVNHNMLHKDESGRRYLPWCDEKKAMEIKPSLLNHDNPEETYLPWCSFRFHLGIIKDESVCQMRNCEHYHRLYIDSNSQYIHEKK